MANVASARARRWLAAGVGLASFAALVATSPPPRYFYSYASELEPTRVELTADTPRLRLRLYARATGLAPNGAPTTAAAAAHLAGRVTSEGVARDGLGAFVSVRVGAGIGDAGSEAIVALTEFTVSSDLHFDGDCAGLSDADPCQGELFIELRRDDGGAGAGTVRVDLNITLSAVADKGEQRPSEGPVEPPWAVVLEAAP